MIYQLSIFFLLGIINCSGYRTKEIIPTDGGRACLGRCSHTITACLYENKLKLQPVCITQLRRCIDTCQISSLERRVMEKRSCTNGCQGEYDACQTIVSTPIDHVTCLQARKSCFQEC